MRGPRPGGGAAACEARVPALAAAWHCSLLAHQLQHCSAAPPPAGRGITAVRPHLNTTSCRGLWWTVSAPGQSGLWRLTIGVNLDLLWSAGMTMKPHCMKNGHSPNQYDDELGCSVTFPRGKFDKSTNAIKALLRSFSLI